MIKICRSTPIQMNEYLLTICICMFVLYFWRSKRARKLPPGPWALPVVGYLPFLTEKPYLELQRLAKIYGSVFSIRLGSQYAIVLNDFQSIKDAFSREEFIGRPPEFSFQLTEETKRTGAFLGPAWKEQRRFSLHMLRDLGFGKTKMEGCLREEIEELLSHFEQNSGQPFCPRNLLSSSMSNNIASLMFGRRFKYDDPRQKMNKYVDETNSAAVQTSWKQFIPWLKYLFEVLGIGEVDRINQLSIEGRAYFLKEILEHETTLNSEIIRDYIDGYLLEMRKRKGDPSFNKYVLQDMVAAFFSAGSETVRTTLEWLILLVAQYQEHQRRLQAEIDDIVGENRVSIWQDYKNMPFTTAYIMEMQRWKTLIPVNLVRYTLADTELNGYFFPKHTHILSNLWSVHHDVEYWGEDVEEFRPERFLTVDEKAVKRMDHYIPFSIGKRACPGEPLANIEIFLYFTAILQRFDIRFPDGKEADFEPMLGITLRPQIQNVIMTKRN